MPTRPRSIADLPETLPLFPVTGALLFPRLQSPLQVFEDRYVALVDHILAGNRLVGLIQPEDSEEESPQDRTAPLHHVGTIGYLAQFEELEDSRYMIGLEGICRFDLTGEVETDAPFRIGQIKADRFLSDFDQSTQAPAVDRERFVNVMRAYVDFMEIDVDWEEVERTETADLVNLGCMLSPYGSREKQMLLEAKTLNERAETLMALVEIQIAQANSDMSLQ